MKKVCREILEAAVMGILVPGALLWFGVALLEIPGEQTLPEIETTAPGRTEPYTVSVRTGEKLLNCELEEYLVGVVLAEMPASFEDEALKAQAVVARTYTMRADITGGKHGDGSVCTDYACCQAYISEADYLAQGGAQSSVDKIRRAVDSTTGLVLTYEGELIEATYFSCSGGSTEDAAAVWGTDYPYLQATASPGEEDAAHYTDTVTYTSRQFLDAIGADLPGSPETWFGPVTYTEGGGVDTMVIGGKEFKGTQLRQLLSLRSTAFSVSAGDTITITTRGYGHRVGMSQYGADAMAVSGKSYADILAHYYRGTAVSSLSDILN